MTEAHRRQLRRLALVILVGVPLVLEGFALAAYLTRWEVAEAARTATRCALLVLAACILAPLVLPHPALPR